MIIVNLDDAGIGNFYLDCGRGVCYRPEDERRAGVDYLT